MLYSEGGVKSLGLNVCGRKIFCPAEVLYNFLLNATMQIQRERNVQV